MKSIKMRGIAAAVTGALLFGFGANAMADSTDDILNALIAKGVLTEEEGALLQKGRTGEKEAADKKKLEGVSTKIKDGTISWESGDKKNSMALTGRLHFDYRNVSGYETNTDPDTKSIADQFEIRRARIGVKGKFSEHIGYEVVTNAVGSSSNLVDTAFINLGYFKPVQLQAGRFKQPMSLEELTSSNNITFAERSFVNALVPTKKLGAMLHGQPFAGVTYGVSAYQNGFNEADNDTDGKSVAGRLTLNFAEMANWKDSVLHVGFSGYDGEWSTKPTSTSQWKSSYDGKTKSEIMKFGSEGRGLDKLFRARIRGSDMASGTINNGASLDATVDQKAFGIELAASTGPFKIQGEYVKAKYDAAYGTSGVTTSTAADIYASTKGDVNAWYAAASWMLTGETYANAYKAGAWGGIKPNNPFDIETGKGKGAWELAARYSKFDASDLAGNVSSASRTEYEGTPKADSYTVALNWYLNTNTRFLLDYVHTKFDKAFSPIDTGLAAEDNEKVVSMRGQWMF